MSADVEAQPDAALRKLVDRESERKYVDGVFGLAHSCKTDLAQHQLSTAYFGFRNWWLMFIPTQILVLSSAVLSFVSTSNSNKTVSFVVGCIASLGATFSALDRYLNWKTRADMHAAAHRTLKKMVHDFDTNLKYHWFDSSDDAKKTRDKIDFTKYRKKWEQIGESCTSAFPVQIATAFELAHSDLDTQLEKVSSLEEYYDMMRIRMKLNHQITTVIMQSPAWPLFLPDANSVSTRALKRLFLFYAGKKCDRKSTVLESLAGVLNKHFLDKAEARGAGDKRAGPPPVPNQPKEYPTLPPPRRREEYPDCCDEDC